MNFRISLVKDSTQQGALIHVNIHYSEPHSLHVSLSVPAYCTRGWTRWPPEVPYNSKDSMILRFHLLSSKYTVCIYLFNPFK